MRQYIELKQHGDHLVALGPFHDDYNPQFTVFPHPPRRSCCFGCHAGSDNVSCSSDHITFLRPYHQLPFPKAVELLADIRHPPLPQQQQSQTTTTVTSQQTNHQTQPPPSHPAAAEMADPPLSQLSQDPIGQQIFNLAAQFYHQQLFQPAAKFALD